MFDYYSTWRTDRFECDCGWSGPGSALALELFEALMEVHCPRCDAKFGLMPFPNREQTQSAADEGNVEAASELQRFSAYDEVQRELAESRQRISELPDLTGDVLTFTFGVEGGEALNPAYLTIKHEGVEIYRERSGFEWWSSLLELSTLLMERYPGRISWIDPTNDADQLLGDDLSASKTIRAFLADHGVSPPTGDWAMRE